MTNFNPTNLLVGRDILFPKNLPDINFREILSLFFHAIENISLSDYPCSSEQKKIFTQFYTDFKNNILDQNKMGWPKLNYIKNDYKRLFEIFTPSLYYPSKNILVLLLRLLHIETFKDDEIRTIKTETIYHQVLSHKVNIGDKYNCKEISLVRLFEILKEYMNYYVAVYNHTMCYENRLGLAILSQM